MANAYPLVFTIGTLLGFLWIGLTGSARPRTLQGLSTAPQRIQSFDAALFMLTGGLIGARSSYVLLHWGYYATRPIEAFMLWQGGLTWVGGALGALLGLLLYARLSRLAFWPLADRLAVPGVLVALSAWLGCLVEGCAYGRRVDESTWAPVVKDMFAGLAPRWPTQAVGVIFSLLTILVLLRVSERNLKQGITASLGLSLIALCAFGLSFTRSDPVMLLAGMRLDSVGAAAVLLIALSSLLIRLKTN